MEVLIVYCTRIQTEGKPTNPHRPMTHYENIPNVSEMLEVVNQEYRDGKLTRKAYLSKFSRVKNTNSLSNKL